MHSYHKKLKFYHLFANIIPDFLDAEVPLNDKLPTVTIPL